MGEANIREQAIATGADYRVDPEHDDAAETQLVDRISSRPRADHRTKAV